MTINLTTKNYLMDSPETIILLVILFFYTVFLVSFAISFATKLAGDFDTENLITIIAVVLISYIIGFLLIINFTTITLLHTLFWTSTIVCAASLILVKTFKIKGLLNFFIYLGMSIFLSIIPNIMLVVTLSYFSLLSRLYL